MAETFWPKSTSNALNSAVTMLKKYFIYCRYLLLVKLP